MTQSKQNAVAVQDTENKVTQQLLMDYLKNTNSNLQPNEQAQFLAIAQTFNLNPWKREVYAIAYGQGNGRKLSIIVGYEVYLRRAEGFPQYDGYETEFHGQGTEMSCTCKVYRKDRNRPTGATVFLREYSQNNNMWNTKTHVMLEKVAIATALRRAFPMEFNGMPYIADELPDNMTGADRLNQQGYTEVHTCPNIPEQVPEQETIPENKTADPVPLDDRKRTAFYTKLSEEANRLGTKVVTEVTDRYGGTENIVSDRNIAKAVIIELGKMTPATAEVNEEEVPF